MYLMYGEYDIVKQQEEYHQTLPVVDDSIRKYTFWKLWTSFLNRKLDCLISVP